MIREVKFESQDRRIKGIIEALNANGIKDIEEANAICEAAGVDPYKTCEETQPICFENAKWAYVVGAAIAIKKGCKNAADAAEAIGIGLQAFCIPGSVADDRKVGIGHGNLAAMLLREETKCFAFLAGHESFAAAEGAIKIAAKADKVRKEPLRCILNGLGKDAAQIISRINGFTYVQTQFDYFTGELKVVREIAYSDGPRAKVKCYGADDVREGVAIMWKEGVDVSITGNSTNPTRFQHPVAGGRKGLLEEAVDALGRLVQQEQLRPGKQHLRQRRPLLLTAGQIVGMALQQRRDLTDFRRFPDILLVLRHFLQIFQHRFLDEQALGVLRKHGEAAPEQLLLLVFFHRLSQHLHLAPIGSANAADGFQRCGFSRAVAAHDGVKASLRHLHAGPPENVRAVLFIAEPQFFQGKGDFAVFFCLGLCRKLDDFRRVRENIAEPVSALPHGQGALPRPAAAVKHPHRRGHGGKHIVLFLPEPLTDVPGGVVGNHFSAVHHDGAVSVRENILHAMLCNEDGRSQFCVDLPQGVQKIGSRNGVKLALSVVEDLR